jgi:quercetin dioxygenase-like cupin family protein
MTTIDREEVLARWRDRGFRGGLWVDPPGQVWEGFVHDEDELLMVVQGRLEIELPGRRIVPALGEEIEIPAGVPHSVRNVGETIARWLYAYGIPPATTTEGCPPPPGGAPAGP